MRIKLLLGNVDQHAVTGGLFTKQEWRLSSVYDPDLTGGGNQPIGFDAMATLYTRYVVHAARVKFSQNQNYGVAIATKWAIVVSRLPYSSGLLASWNDILSQPGVRFGHVGPGDNEQHGVISVDLNKVRGKTAVQAKADDSETSAVTTNPADNVFMAFYYEADNTTTATVCTQIQIEFDVEFFEHKDQATN